MIFRSAYAIQLYLLNGICKLDEEMKKEYMKKRVDDWCKSHDYDLYIDGTAGVYVLVDNRHYDDDLCHDRLFPSLTKLYNYLFNGQRD